MEVGHFGEVGGADSAELRRVDHEDSRQAALHEGVLGFHLVVIRSGHAEVLAEARCGHEGLRGPGVADQPQPFLALEDLSVLVEVPAGEDDPAGGLAIHFEQRVQGEAQDGDGQVLRDVPGHILCRGARVDDDDLLRGDQGGGLLADLHLLFPAVGALVAQQVAAVRGVADGHRVGVQDRAAVDQLDQAILVQVPQVPADGHFRDLEHLGQLPDRGGVSELDGVEDLAQASILAIHLRRPFDRTGRSFQYW